MQPLTQSNIFGISYWNARNYLWPSMTILIHCFKPKPTRKESKPKIIIIVTSCVMLIRIPMGVIIFSFFFSLSPPHWLKGGNLQVLIPAAGPVNRSFWMKSVCPDTLGTLLAGWGVMNHLHSDRRVLKSRALNGRFKPNTHSHLQHCIHHFFQLFFLFASLRLDFFFFFF